MNRCPNLELPLSAERRKMIGVGVQPRQDIGVRTFKIAITRPVRVSQYKSVLRTKFVWSTSKSPRIAGTITTIINSKES
jgi:hypothetical protein